ncbi:hypothetical protein b3_0231 [Synechococcus phage B3]|nr:hypothetical protein b3_0231 [Synechococcus phage B3]QGT54840.1 hypothetical protein b23_0225 [Synechococcus phage B23]
MTAKNNSNNEVFKRASSFNSIIPSTDMSIEEYETFLNCAKPHELELDVVSQDTYYKICNILNIPTVKPKFPHFRCAT